MKGELIKTEEGYYLIDESDIKADSYYLAWETNHNIPKWVRYVLCSGLNGIKQFNIVASNLDLEGLYKLSLKNCEAVFNGYDLDELDKLAREWYAQQKFHGLSDTVVSVGYLNMFKAGFQKALELMKHRLVEETEWAVEIEMECPQCQDWGYISECRNNCNKKFLQPKLDADGCLILKRK